MTRSNNMMHTPRKSTFGMSLVELLVAMLIGLIGMTVIMQVFAVSQGRNRTTGGMGDVLSGLIGGFLAQGLSPWQACCLGVYSHGLAGDRLAAETPSGFLASELSDQLPFVLENLRI